MKNLFYTLVFALFALNISAQNVYIVSNLTDMPTPIVSRGYTISEIPNTSYTKAFEITGTAESLTITVGSTTKRINKPATNVYYIVTYSGAMYIITETTNNTYTATLYTNLEDKANIQLQTSYNATYTTQTNVYNYNTAYTFTWQSFWNEDLVISHTYYRENGETYPTVASLVNKKEYVLTYDYQGWHFNEDELTKPTDENYQLACVKVEDKGTIFTDGNVEENNGHGFFKEIVRTKTYTAADVENWIWISSPYRANIVIKDANGNQLSQAYYFNDGDYRGGDYLLKYYDTEAAANGSENTWVDTRINVLEAGKGYILGINPEGLTAPFTATITSTPNQIIDTYTRIGFGHNNDYPSTIDNKHSNLHLVGSGLYNEPRGLNFGGKVAHFCIPAEDGYSYQYQFNMSESDYESKINYIQPYTAFFMQYAGDFYFHNYNGTEIAPRAPRRTVDVAQEMEIYELSLNDKKTTIMMDPDGSEGYTVNEDFIYLTKDVNGTNITNQFYTFDGEDQLSFNHRKNQNQTITLGGKVATTGEYTISLNGINTTAKSVTLFDAVENTTTELTTDDYTFTAESGSINNRFVITFSFAPGVTTDVFATEANQLVVSGNADNCSIENLIAGEDVMIFDAMGRLVYNAQADATAINVSLTAGTYIVRQANNFAKFVIK